MGGSRFSWLAEKETKLCCCRLEPPCHLDVALKWPLVQEAYDAFILFIVFVKILYNDVPFFGQCFLNVAMAFERFYLICKPHDAEMILTTRRLFLW